MKAQMDKVRNHLGDLGALAGKTELAEKQILAQAQKRLTEVETAIQRARPGVEAAPETAQDRYLDLLKERGQLNIVISKAQHALGLS